MTRPAAPARPNDAGRSTNDLDLRILVFVLFFVFGGITSLNDVIIPKLKLLFKLSYSEAMLVQFAFFGAYLVISMPAAALVRRVGYMRAATIGILTMMAGCLCFIPAASLGIFPPFLIAVFALATGITIIQVVANPLISMLGDAASAASRLTFAQAFNSLGTTLFPYAGSILILGSLSTVDPATLDAGGLMTFRLAETKVIVTTYIGLALALAALAALVWSRRARLRAVSPPPTRLFAALSLLGRKRFGLGVLSIFLYVGAEVSIGSLIVSFLMRPDVLALDPRSAGQHVPFYWGGAMIGRFVGASILRLVPPSRVLAAAAALAMVLLGLASTLNGGGAGWALLAIGLCNSIMFPTIFSLASVGLGSRADEGSGVICMAIVGGAIIPLLTGRVADWGGLRLALVVPALCYAGIIGFAWFTSRASPAPAAAAVR